MPKAGWAIVWLRTPAIRRLAIFAVPLLLALLGLWRIWRLPATTSDEVPDAPRAPRRSSELRRPVRWGAVLGSALAAFVVASVSLAGLSSLASGGPQTIVTKRIFPGPRSLAAQDVRDASSGAETNKSDAYSYADAVVTPTSTAIASGTNRYLEFTMNSGRPGGLSVSSPQFNFRLASAGGAQAGNACFWFEVRSGGSVIGTHGSYASAAGCSTGTTQTTISTAMPEVTSTDQVNGLVVRVYLWETGTKTKTVNVDLATRHAARRRTTRSPPTRSRRWTTPAARPTTAPWSLATVDATTYTDATNWPSATPATTKYLKLTLEPSVPTGSVVTAVSLTNVWHASAAVTNGGTPLLLPRDLQRRDLARHARQRRLAAGVHEQRHGLQRATRSPCRR